MKQHHKHGVEEAHKGKKIALLLVCCAVGIFGCATLHTAVMHDLSVLTTGNSLLVLMEVVCELP